MAKAKRTSANLRQSVSVRTAKPAGASAIIEDLATANLILSHKGIFEAYGHVSGRDPVNPERYWISRSMAPALVTKGDIIECDLDNNPICKGETSLFFERIIHGEIYKARPDVMAVIHNHSPSLIPFCNSETRLRPMTGNAAFLGEAVPLFDIRTVDDDGDLNVCTPAQGRAMALALGQSALVLLRGHGAVAVGASIRMAVRCAIVAEVNARQQLEAAILGPAKFLSASELEYGRTHQPKDPGRAWEFWKREAMRRK